MIDFYLEFSTERIGRFMKFLKLRTSAVKKSMMTASIFALNFFAMSELILTSSKMISGVSIIGGVIVFGILSIYLVKKKRHPSCDNENKTPLALYIFFKVHVAVTLILYLFIIFSFWR